MPRGSQPSRPVISRAALLPTQQAVRPLGYWRRVLHRHPGVLLRRPRSGTLAASVFHSMGKSASHLA